METLDLVVVGAGMYYRRTLMSCIVLEGGEMLTGWAGLAGLCAAKTYHQLNPTENVAIIEANPSLGGVWSKERLYPSLKTNNMLGTYEYADFPMDTETYGVKPGEFMSGEVMHKYLSNYAAKFGIADKIRYQSKVLTAEHQDGPDGGWTLTVQSGSSTSTITARKLIMATGLTSEPFLPHFKGQEEFGAPLFHSKDFLRHADTLNSSKVVTVFGTTKSAWDAVYAYGAKGIKVHWIIRGRSHIICRSNEIRSDLVPAESGHGPAWMAPPYVTPLKKWLEKLTRE